MVAFGTSAPEVAVSVGAATMLSFVLALTVVTLVLLALPKSIKPN